MKSQFSKRSPAFLSIKRTREVDTSYIELLPLELTLLLYKSNSLGVTMEVVNYSAWLPFVAEGIDSHFVLLYLIYLPMDLLHFCYVYVKFDAGSDFLSLRVVRFSIFLLLPVLLIFFYLVISPKLNNRFSSFLVCNIKISS